MKIRQWLSCEKELFDLNRRSLDMSRVVFGKEGAERVDAAEDCRVAVHAAYDNLSRTISHRALMATAPLLVLGTGIMLQRQSLAGAFACAAGALLLGAASSTVARLRVRFYKRAIADAYTGAIAHECVNNPAAFAESDFAATAAAPGRLRAEAEAALSRRETIEARYADAEAHTVRYFAQARPKTGRNNP